MKWLGHTNPATTQQYAWIKPTKLAVRKENIMSTITKEALQQLLEKCITIAVDEAQKEISDSLPAQMYLGLEAFGQQGKDLSLDEVLSFLYRDGTFPRIVDIAVKRGQ
jgi:hypothetical protein